NGDRVATGVAPQPRIRVVPDRLKTLLLDIETAPNLVHVWGLWQQNVHIGQIIDAGYVLCWAAKWYGNKEVMFDSVHQSKPSKMLKRIHKLIDEAEVVVHYNGRSFDMPTLNKEFIVANMTPPSPYKQVDLCRVAKEAFRFPSNKLEYIAKTLGLGEKTKHEGHELWIKCMKDDPEAWARMETYNRNDVVLLEAVYDRCGRGSSLTPTMDSMTNLAFRCALRAVAAICKDAASRERQLGSMSATNARTAGHGAARPTTNCRRKTGK